MEELKPKCEKCNQEPCKCNETTQGIIMGDMLNTGIPGGLDFDFTTPI